jgi:hypothetical protein
MLSYGADPSPNVAAALRRLTRSLRSLVSKKNMMSLHSSTCKMTYNGKQFIFLR